MDANGTRYHLLLGYDDWAACTDGRKPLSVSWDTSTLADDTSGVSWNHERSEVRLQPRLFLFTASPKDTGPKLEDRRGGGADRYGNWYWIADSRQEILVNSAGSRLTSHFWSTEDAAVCEPDVRYGDFQDKDPEPRLVPLSLSGLAVTEDHYLVVGVLEPPGLLIFDLYTGGAPQQIAWPVPFAPFDMAPAPAGGVWILDRDHRCYWALDRHFSVIANDQTLAVIVAARRDDFQPVDGTYERRTPERLFPEGISLHASPLDIENPIAIEGLPDGTVLILESRAGQRFSLVYHYRFAERLGLPVSTESISTLVEPSRRAGFRLLAHDFAFVAEHKDADGNTVPDRLYFVGQDGNQAFVFNVSQAGGQLVMEPLPDYLPMRLFGGKGLVAANFQVYYDFADRWIPLVEQRRPSYVPEATFYTYLGEARPALDGREPNCVWHRLMLDGCIPSDTEVVVGSRAANDIEDLAWADWQQEPTLYLRGDGSELPFVRRPTMPGGGTWELLFQQARGRYLQLRFTLRGNGRSTPTLRALRVYYPRFSYRDHYLPAVYREEPASASFIDRFLANVEGSYTALEDKIAAVQMLFDVRSAPPEALAWLAGWFGVALDPLWDEARQRLFIQHAMVFFQYRGTIRGLLMALRLALEECPDERIFTGQSKRRSAIRIIEKYRTRRTPGVVLGDPTEESGLRIVPRTARWLPKQGAANLHQRYAEFLQANLRQPFRAFLRSRGITPHADTEFPLLSPGEPADRALWEDFGRQAIGLERQAAFETLTRFPLQPPTNPAQRQLWRQFAQDTLGFVPSASASDLGPWQEFLTRRYHRISAFNEAYRLRGSQRMKDFTAVPILTALPPDGQPLQDWFQFESIVLAMHRTAHQFSVLLPVPRTGTLDDAEQQRWVEITRRIVNLEKPAHTTFDVRFYWAMFRIGEARLGEDTAIEHKSRIPPMVLGQRYLVESYVSGAERGDRQILGCEPLNG